MRCSHICTVCLFSNETKDENIALHQDYVKSCTIAHMRDTEKLQQCNYVMLSSSSSWTGQNTPQLLFDDPSSVSSIDSTQVAAWPGGERQMKTEEQQSLKRTSIEWRNTSPKIKTPAYEKPPLTLNCTTSQFWISSGSFWSGMLIAPSKSTHWQRRTWKTD